MAKHSLLINVDEIWLKGGNRPRYMKILKDHIKDLFKAYDIPTQFENVNQRFLVNLDGEITTELLDSLMKVPGIYSIIPAALMEKTNDLAQIWSAVEREVEGWGEPVAGGRITFKVEGHRTDKQFPMNSMEIERAVGAYVLKKYDGKLKVDVHRPEHNFYLPIPLVKLLLV